MEEKSKKALAVKIAGPAGYGIMEAGRILGQALANLGFSVLVYPEYPSRIRGGDNVSLVTFSQGKDSAPAFSPEVLVTFSHESFLLHYNEVEGEGINIVDEDFASQIEGSNRLLVFPFTQVAEETAHHPLARNTVALGLIWGIFALPLPVLEKEIKKAFLNKGKAVLEGNQKAVRAGYRLAKEKNLWGRKKVATSKKNKGSLYSGNEAIAQGIMDAQCGYAAIYPMTPINSILTVLAAHQEKTGMIIFRPEDEIAGINSAVGASFAGKRSLVATSGGGFCLMNEGFGMAGATETPLVVVEGMRTGPSSGMATWSSQEDLLFVINAANGEFPRFVFAPGDPQEAYDLTLKAFELAEKYQTPAVVLTDKYLSESAWAVSLKRGKIAPLRGHQDWPKNYRRYENTKSGISPRAFPGEAVFLTNSYVHNEAGFSIEDGETRVKMKEKLFRKMASFKERGTRLYGPQKAVLTFVSFGSAKGAVLAAMEALNEKKKNQANFLHFYRPWPFPQEAVKILSQAKKFVAVENNSTGQLAKLIRRETGIDVDQKILKDDGRPFFEGEIVSSLNH